MDNDNGTLTFASTEARPNPWPISVDETDLAELRVDFGSANANDRYSLFVDAEEWLEL